MAKKFMFVCFGLLALAVTFHLGAQYGQAGYVDHSTTGVVSAIFDSVNWTAVLMDNGQVWRGDAGGRWEFQPRYSPPIPVSQVKFWGYYWVISENNDLWAAHSYDAGWSNVGSPPGGVAVQPSTWGSIKAQFNK